MFKFKKIIFGVIAVFFIAMQGCSEFHSNRISFRGKQYIEGIRLLRLNEFDNSINILNKYIDENPNDAVARAARAYALTKVNKHLDALNDWSRAIKIEPDDQIKGTYMLGRSYTNANYGFYRQAKSDHAYGFILKTKNKTFKSVRERRKYGSPYDVKLDLQDGKPPIEFRIEFPKLKA